MAAPWRSVHTGPRTIDGPSCWDRGRLARSGDQAATWYHELAITTDEDKPIDIDLRDIPLYSVAMAAHHARMSEATLRSWVQGRSYPTAEGRRRSEPVLRLPKEDDSRLSFNNLVEAHILVAIRKAHEVPMGRVRTAVQYAEDELGIERLLIRGDLLTAHKSLFLRHMGHLVNLGRSGELALEELLAAHLRRVFHDADGMPIKLYPFVSGSRDDRRTIVIDPRISFGRPVVAGRGVSTWVLARRYDAGEAIDELAEDYQLKPAEVEEAILYEGAAAA